MNSGTCPNPEVQGQALLLLPVAFLFPFWISIIESTIYFASTKGEKKRLYQKEVIRPEILYRYAVSDPALQRSYQDLCKLASRVSETPVAAICFTDGVNNRVISQNGTPLSEKEIAFLGSLSFSEHSETTPFISIMPQSVGEIPALVFYAGHPLINPDNSLAGHLWVMDYRTRNFSQDQLDSLNELSSLALALLEGLKKSKASQELEKELELRDEQLEQFVKRVSHDIKSPLTNILLSSHLLKESYTEKFGGEGLELLNIMSKAVRKTIDFVDAVLPYHSGEYFLSEDHELVNLTELIESVIDLAKMNTNAIIEYPKGNIIIKVKKSILDQVLLNLLTNSIKYNDKETIVVNISFAENEKYYFFSVKDNGMGIEPAKQKKVFSLFTNLGIVDRFGNKGSGMGLATIKKLVERQGGEITFVSQYGQGAEFFFSIRKVE
ncbi:MAG TPA: HAMP domain-containing sensor histidine kinase [Puia sp.]|nr:HAMP domain-containing sensor histidine kinase [Puia sp.]